MKKILNNLRTRLHVNKNLFVFLVVMVIVGVTAGAFFSSVLGIEDKQLVTDYLNDFFNNSLNDNLEYNVSTSNTLIFTLGFSLVLWVLGISVIGFVFIIVLLFIKSFIVGFSIGSLIINFKAKGILLSLGYVFPHHIVNLFIYILLCAYALYVSFRIIRAFTGKKELDFKNVINRYSFVLCFSLIVLTFTSLYEVYCMPVLMNFLVQLVN